MASGAGGTRRGRWRVRSSLQVAGCAVERPGRRAGRSVGQGAVAPIAARSNGPGEVESGAGGRAPALQVGCGSAEQRGRSKAARAVEAHG